MPSREQRAPPEPRGAGVSLWRSQWGLQFQSTNGDVQALEQSFWESRAASHQATAAVLSAGVALVHGLLAFKLNSQGQTKLALAASTTMAQQLLVWLLAVTSPSLFSRLRPLLYAFSATFPTIHASPIFSNTLSVGSCGSPSSPAFWVSQLLASGVPWLVVHAVLFPLTINQGIVVHGVATVLLLASNRERCVSALQQCPAAGPVMVRVASALQRLSVFSATRGSWLGSDSSAAGSGAAPGPQLQLRSCMGAFAALQIAIGYLAVLQLAWWLERAARLAFLRRTDEVEAEWRLERKQRPPGSLTLELAALLLLSWQAVDLWLAAV